MKKYLYLLALLPFACNPKEKIAPENPCDGLHETSAAFTMMETFLGPQYNEGWDYYDTDTTIGGRITFSALQQKADSFIWQIGSEVEPRRGNEVLVTFYNMGNQTIKIKLIVYAKPNKKCFPFDNGIDTFERYLTFKQYPDYFGTWEGYRTDYPNIIYKMGIGYFNYLGANPFTPGFLNLKNHCLQDTIVINNGSFGYKQFVFLNPIYTDYCYSIRRGKIKVINDNITINFDELKDTTGKNVFDFASRTFIGKRIK
jgi:hypothetical protein